jgi:hypothetical protein
MKILKFLILIVFVLSLFSCDKNDTEKTNNPDVETYIELLKTNQYESSNLPEFSSNEIPALLKYINDNSVVNKFPYHPASSYAPTNPEYRLGVLLLWTIESIRVAEFNNRNIGFPSQHPFVKTKTEPIEWIIDHDNKIYEIIKQSYSNWWNENKHKEFGSFCNIDPLLETEYRWH